VHAGRTDGQIDTGCCALLPARGRRKHAGDQAEANPARTQRGASRDAGRWWCVGDASGVCRGSGSQLPACSGARTRRRSIDGPVQLVPNRITELTAAHVTPECVYADVIRWCNPRGTRFRAAIGTSRESRYGRGSCRFPSRHTDTAVLGRRVEPDNCSAGKISHARGVWRFRGGGYSGTDILCCSGGSRYTDGNGGGGKHGSWGIKLEGHGLLQCQCKRTGHAVQHDCAGTMSAGCVGSGFYDYKEIDFSPGCGCVRLGESASVAVRP
jgi:hypothetical protein